MLEVATAVTAEQVIRYAIDGTLLGRRGTAAVYPTAGDDDVGRGRRGVRSDAGGATGRVVRVPRDRRRLRPSVRAAGIPAAAMVPGYLTLDDPQLRPAGSSSEVDHAHVGRQEYPTWPMRLSAGPRRWRGPAPTLGEHTDEVLRGELGVTDDELAPPRRPRDRHQLPNFG